MLYRHEPYANAADAIGSYELLQLKSGSRSQPALVEQLGGKPANCGGKSPRLGQKEPSVSSHGRRALKDVFESRYADTFRVCPLLRLLKLLGIPQQDDALATLRQCQDVRERHLPCLIHEENVYRLVELLA